MAPRLQPLRDFGQDRCNQFIGFFLSARHMEGPFSAPSSPPETPVPIKLSLLQKAHGYDEWCPGRRCYPINDDVTFIEVWLEGINSSIVPAPAFTINRMRRGVSRDSTTLSPYSKEPVFCLDFRQSLLRLFTGTVENRDGITTAFDVSARLRPITAIPTTPICCFDMFTPVRGLLRDCGYTAITKKQII